MANKSNLISYGNPMEKSWALAALCGSGLHDIIRTRVILTNIDD